MTIDWTKPVQTRNGQPVEIITTRARYPEYKVWGYIGDSYISSVWKLDGTNVNEAESHHLINVPPPKKVGWINIYPGTGTLYSSINDAKMRKGFDILARVRIEYAEGQFDD